MIYRCPYCQHEMGAEKLPACPSCGRKMNYRERRTPAERREDKLKIKLIEREALQKRSAFDAVATSNFLRNPRVLLWAVFVLGLLAYLMYQASQGVDFTTRAQIAKAQKELNVLAGALAWHHIHTGHWPSTHAGLKALLRRPDETPEWDGTAGWYGPYLLDRLDLPTRIVPYDPWGQPYVYGIATNGAVVLFSKGPDMVSGTGDDIWADPKSFIITKTNQWVSAEERLPRVIPVNVVPQ